MDIKFIFLKELFYIFTGSLIIFCILEIISPNLALAYVNINLVLIVWFTNGILILTNKTLCTKK